MVSLVVSHLMVCGLFLSVAARRSDSVALSKRLAIIAGADQWSGLAEFTLLWCPPSIRKHAVMRAILAVVASIGGIGAGFMDGGLP
jgi:uncharacterized membrane protein